MPTFASEVFDVCVTLLLVGFGMRAIGQAARQGEVGPKGLCVHHGTPPHRHGDRWTRVRRPLLVGAVHGLAGSGALTAVVVAALPSTAARITWLALFGFGSTVAMAAMSGLLGWPIARLGNHRAIVRGVSLAVGCVSIGLGVFWGYPLIGKLF